MLNVAIIGLGNRGGIYCRHLKANPNAKIVALCDINESILSVARDTYGLSNTQVYNSDIEFFNAGKLADALVISTGDRDHYAHAIKALNLGYHLLLEKPISPIWSECLQIADLAREKGLKVVVCHVLRYSAFYDRIKSEIDAKVIGDIVSVDITENVGYWHYSHSYVRGNWHNEAQSGPSILAKCCHDLDMIHYMTGQRCTELFSVGSRSLFTLENAPEGSSEYCLDPCQVRKSCPYDVKKIYYGITRYTLPLLIVKKKLITGKGKSSYSDLKEALIKSDYGRCVYRCNNDVMENQTVSLKLQNGVTGILHMNAFSKMCFRAVYISGTKGEIRGNDKDGKFKLNIFAGPSKTIHTKSGTFYNHLGGDAMLVKDFVDYLDSGIKNSRVSTI
ncbi:MAG: Gfo/Idh/MocA family oxidoreductase, partial [Christensenellaceae bacterium]|nr:Gfo/Idh/MocA family oxidoreductase [Christensenellaceae bacterium]